MDENNNNGFAELEKKSEEQNGNSSPEQSGIQGQNPPQNNYNGQNYNSMNYNNSEGYNNNYSSPYNQNVNNGYNQTPQGRTPYGQPNLNQNDYRYPHPDSDMGNMNAPQGGYNGGYYNPQNPQNNPYYQNGYNNQGYNGYNGYNDPYAGYNMQPSQNMAVASLVCGIVGLFTFIFGWIFMPLFLVPIAAIILGCVHKSKHLPIGKGMSTAGIILGVIGTVLPILFIMIIIACLPQMMEYIEQSSPEQYQEFYDRYGEQFPQYFSILFTNLKAFFIK